MARGSALGGPGRVNSVLRSERPRRRRRPQPSASRPKNNKNISPQIRCAGIEADTKDRKKFNGVEIKQGSRALKRSGCLVLVLKVTQESTQRYEIRQLPDQTRRVRGACPKARPFQRNPAAVAVRHPNLEIPAAAVAPVATIENLDNLTIEPMPVAPNSNRLGSRGGVQYSSR